MKGKKEYLFSAFYILCISQSAQAWIIHFYLHIHHGCLSFVSVNQMAPHLTDVRDILLQLTTYLSTPNGASGPESSTMLCFIDFARWRHQSVVRLRHRYVWSSSPNCGLGGEVAICDCGLILQGVSCPFSTILNTPVRNAVN